MEKRNKFQTVFHKLNKTKDEDEFIITEFNTSDEDEENRSFSDNGSNTSASLNVNTKPNKRTVTPKRKALNHFKPLECVNIKRPKPSDKQKSLNKYEVYNNNNNNTGLNGNEEHFSSEETQIIDWESSEDDETNQIISKDSNATIKNTSTSQNTQNAASKISKLNEYEKKLFRRCRKGSYLYKLKETIEKAKSAQKFLKYDKKFGLRTGRTLSVLEMKQSFGVFIAKCCFLNDQNEYEVILDKNLGKYLKIGDQIDAFFEETQNVYEIESSQLSIILQPRQLLLET